MFFESLLNNLISDTVDQSLFCFSAELALSGTIVLMLLVRLFSADKLLPAYLTATIGATVSLVFAWMQFDTLVSDPESGPIPFFTGLMMQDLFSVYFRLLLALFLLLTIALTVLTGIPDNEDGPDFYSLLFGATIGMMMMGAANHLLMVFIAIEMASVPSYAMVGFLKGRKPSSEAALKYVIYGAGTAGVMLYGISLLAGITGAVALPEVAERITEIAAAGGGIGNPEMRTAALGVLLIMVGVAFKLSLVPFHFWCPDAFEGASAEVAGFLSVASKAGAFGLLIRFCMILSGSSGAEDLLFAFGIGLGVVACITTTFGNLAAYGQTNLKRLLAYSTIAHAGYMLMAVSALMLVGNSEQVASSVGDQQRAIEGVLYYLAVYLFMNLGAFAVVALARNESYREDLTGVRGIISSAPVLCVAMLICAFSLVGLPPFGGFFAKLMVFAAVFAAGEIHWFMYVVLAIGGLNTVFSLFYYIRILKTMILEERPKEDRPVVVETGSLTGIYVTVIALFVMVLGMAPYVPKGLSEVARSAAESVMN